LKTEDGPDIEEVFARLAVLQQQIPRARLALSMMESEERELSETARAHVSSGPLYKEFVLTIGHADLRMVEVLRPTTVLTLMNSLYPRCVKVTETATGYKVNHNSDSPNRMWRNFVKKEKLQLNLVESHRVQHGETVTEDSSWTSVTPYGVHCRKALIWFRDHQSYSPDRSPRNEPAWKHDTVEDLPQAMIRFGHPSEQSCTSSPLYLESPIGAGSVLLLRRL
jgi:hypothetical protein